MLPRAVIAVLLVGLLLAPPVPAAGDYRVGIAVRSINPDRDGSFAGAPVYLGGYGIGSVRPATGVLGKGLRVRAISISDGRGGDLAIADIESQGWFTANKDAPLGLTDMRRAVAARSGGALEPSEVVIQSNHSHSAPDGIGVWGGVPLAYRRLVFGRTVAAILAAHRKARPGKLRYGTVEAPTLLTNQFDYDRANAEVDDELRVLQALGPRGRPFATLLNFSAHTTVLGSDNTRASGDWVQATNPLLERTFGGRAMTMVGTLGRTQPADHRCPDRSLSGPAAHLCRIEDYGARVVKQARLAVARARPLRGRALVDARSYLVQDIGANPLILGLNYAGAPFGADVTRSLSAPWLTVNVVGTVTSSARIGDLLLSAVPGEAYPQIAAVLANLVPARGHMTAGLAGDQLGYLIAPYEAYPEPIRRSFFNQRGDEVSPLDNDNYFFNVSPTIGERVLCSLLRGAGDLLAREQTYRDRRARCQGFANDLGMPSGADARD